MQKCASFLLKTEMKNSKIKYSYPMVKLVSTGLFLCEESLRI